MNIYTISHKEPDHWDACYGHVIVADSEDQVREIAKREAADEGEEVWDTAEIELCGVYTCHRTEPFILLTDFRNG